MIKQPIALKSLAIFVLPVFIYVFAIVLSQTMPMQEVRLNLVENVEAEFFDSTMMVDVNDPVSIVQRPVELDYSVVLHNYFFLMSILIVFVVLCVITIFIACRIIMQGCEGRLRKILLGSALLVSAAQCVFGIVALKTGMFIANIMYAQPRVWSWYFQREVMPPFDQFKVLCDRFGVVVLLLAVSASSFAIVASISLLRGLDQKMLVKVEEISRRMHALRLLLIVVAATLTTKIILVFSWLNWPLAILSGDDWQSAVASFGNMAEGATLFFGVTFSLCLLTVYVPTLYGLTRYSSSLADLRSIDLHPKRSDWYQENEIIPTMSKEAKIMLATVAPAMVTPAMSSLSAVMPW